MPYSPASMRAMAASTYAISRRCVSVSRASVNCSCSDCAPSSNSGSRSAARRASSSAWARSVVWRMTRRRRCSSDLSVSGFLWLTLRSFPSRDTWSAPVPGQPPPSPPLAGPDAPYENLCTSARSGQGVGDRNGKPRLGRLPPGRRGGYRSAMDRCVTIVGGGLAGSEAAWQLARAGVPAVLLEMKPGRRSPAHVQDGLAELVCSNSLRSDDPSNAVGLLHEELRRLGSVVLSAADACRVPAGGALAVDRERFSARVTRILEEHPGVTLRREEVVALPPGPDLALV